LALAALLLGAGTAEVVVPVELQVPLLLKVLDFDRSLRERPGEAVIILVAFQSGFPVSRDLRERLDSSRGSAGSASIQGKPVRWVFLDVTGAAALEREVRGQDAAVVYLAPMRSIDLGALTAAAAAGGALSVTGDLDYVSEGVAVAFGTRGGRPSILINLKAARAAGADFGAQLLQLAEIIDR
jgi:hypothetical protein